MNPGLSHPALSGLTIVTTRELSSEQGPLAAPATKLSGFLGSSGPSDGASRPLSNGKIDLLDGEARINRGVD